MSRQHINICRVHDGFACSCEAVFDADVGIEAVNHPDHYGGDTPYEVIKVCEAWGLDKDAYLFNVVKYVARAGKKQKSSEIEDLKKAAFYLARRIKCLEKI